MSTRLSSSYVSCARWSSSPRPVSMVRLARFSVGRACSGRQFIAGAWQVQPKSAEPRGRKSKRDAAASEIERLQKQVAKLEVNLRKAEIIIDVQKKLSALLGVALPDSDEEEKP